MKVPFGRMTNYICPLFNAFKSGLGTRMYALSKPAESAHRALCRVAETEIRYDQNVPGLVQCEMTTESVEKRHTQDGGIRQEEAD